MSLYLGQYDFSSGLRISGDGELQLEFQRTDVANNPRFRIGRIIPGAGLGPQWRILFETDAISERNIFSIEGETGTMASVAPQGTGGVSHLEAFYQGDVAPLFRINSRASGANKMQLEFRDATIDQPTDIALRREGDLTWGFRGINGGAEVGFAGGPVVPANLTIPGQGLDSLQVGFAAEAGRGVDATGTIDAIAGSLHVDGEQFRIGDGTNPFVDFEFDDNGSVTETDILRAVVFTGSETADQMRDLMITAINGAPKLGIVATDGGAALVDVRNAMFFGTSGNIGMSNTVANVGFMTTGLTAGADGGIECTALGDSTRANGDGCTAVGFLAEALIRRTTAVGRFARATTEDATAVGYNSQSTGVNSAAFGQASRASGSNSAAFGDSSIASTTDCVAVGFSARANAVGATAVGADADATGVDSTALSRGTRASHVGAIALGSGAITEVDNQFKIGSDDEEISEVNIEQGANGQRTLIKTATTTIITDTGASVTAVGLIPAGAVVVGFTSRITTVITGPTDIDMGPTGNLDKFGAVKGVALDTITDNTDWTDSLVENFTSATDVTVTANGGNFTGGVIRLTVTYISVIAPIS